MIAILCMFQKHLTIPFSFKKYNNGMTFGLWLDNENYFMKNLSFFSILMLSFVISSFSCKYCWRETLYYLSARKLTHFTRILIKIEVSYRYILLQKSSLYYTICKFVTTKKWWIVWGVKMIQSSKCHSISST